ncbi:MAG: hypothetical protein LBQ83_05390 [Candidatus Margulisbacteria bacterium]|jgi:proline racemase|nr:hypothetical protein [Candidatus Margulisiibacteriota bacterium]
MRKLAIGLLLLLAVGLAAETRTYRQIKDVAAKQNGQVKTSRAKGNLFTMTYEIDRERGLVTRRHIRRLDDKSDGRPSRRQYTIVEKKYVLRSPAGEGGNAIVAVNSNTGELLLLGDTFALTSRTSDFAQMITGIYQRID